MNVLQKIRSRGFWYLVGILFNRVVPAWLVRFRVFRIYELAANPPAVSPNEPPTLNAPAFNTPTFNIARCDLRIDSQLARTVTQAGDAAMNYDALECWLCSDGDDPIGGLWIARQSFLESELGVQIVLGDEQLWMFSAYIRKDRRGERAYDCLLQEVLQQSGGASVYCAINPVNRASIAAHRRRVKGDLGTFIALKILGTSICLGGGNVKPNSVLSLRATSSPIKIDLSTNSDD